METAGVCAEATGTAAIGAATEKARTIAATVGVRISVSFTRNPSQREDAIDAGDGEHQHPARQVKAVVERRAHAGTAGSALTRRGRSTLPPTRASRPRARRARAGRSHRHGSAP